MTDRRETVARAIRAERYTHTTAIMDDPTPTAFDYLLADAAIAALDQTTVYECNECGGIGQVVEPTELTEVDPMVCIRQSDLEELLNLADDVGREFGDDHCTTDACLSARAALIAVRKVNRHE